MAYFSRYNYNENDINITNREGLIMVANENTNNARTGNEIIDDFIKIRKSRHLSQTEIARKSGLHQAAVGRIENKSAEPRLETLLKMLNTMGLTLAIVPEYFKPEYAINLEISEVLETLRMENRERVKAYAEGLHEEELRRKKEAFDELMSLSKPCDLGDDYKAILEEELIRKYESID